MRRCPEYAKPARLYALARRLWYSRLRGPWHRYQWSLVVLLGLVSILLGYIGFTKWAAESGDKSTRWDLFYLSLQLFVLQSGSVAGAKCWELEVSRFLAPALTIYTAAAAVAAIFYEELHAIRLRRAEDHTVICGLGYKGMLLARELLSCGETVVIVDRAQDNPFVEQARGEGALVLIADATDRKALRAAGVDKAKCLVAACSDDGVNAEIAARARELARGDSTGTLTCFVHIVEPELCNLLGEQEVGREKGGAFRLEFFNIYDTGARALLKEYPVVPARGDGGGPPHIVVVGAGRMGQNVILHAAWQWRLSRGAAGGHFRATIVDRDANRKAEGLYMRHPQLRKVAQLIPAQMDLEWPDFQQAKFLFDSSGRCDATIIYVCLDNNSVGLTAALTLLQHTRKYAVPIIVRMTDDAGLAALLQHGDAGASAYETLRPFCFLKRACRADMLLSGTNETLARAIHEDYVLNQTKAGETSETNQSIAPWEELPEYLRESNRRQADHIGAKLRAVNCAISRLREWDAENVVFTPEEVELMARMEHKRWMDDYLLRKWTYAPGPKDSVRKTHPRLLPWDRLSEEGREIHRNTVRGLPGFLARANLQVTRPK